LLSVAITEADDKGERGLCGRFRSRIKSLIPPVISQPAQAKPNTINGT